MLWPPSRASSQQHIWLTSGNQAPTCYQRLPFIGLLKFKIDLLLVDIVMIMTLKETQITATTINRITIAEAETGEEEIIIKVEEIEAAISRMTVLNLVNNTGILLLSRMFKTM